jgi:hypothetical protein
MLLLTKNAPSFLTVYRRANLTQAMLLQVKYDEFYIYITCVTWQMHSTIGTLPCPVAQWYLIQDVLKLTEVFTLDLQCRSCTSPDFFRMHCQL